MRSVSLLLSIGARLALWCLLSMDLRPGNLLIGLAVALLLPRRGDPPLPLPQLLGAVGRALAAIPEAYGQAFALILAPRCQERLVSLERREGSGNLLLVLEIFRVTLTPLTLVLGLEADGRRLLVHELVPERRRWP